MDNSKQYIREGQKVTFSAQLEKGDRRLTSWIVYEGNQCDDNHIVKEEKQVGTEFSHIFEKAGEYTIVSYGKRDEINKSTATKVQVGKPVLEGIECVERANTYFKNNVYIVKKGTKVTFRLKFKDNILPTSDKLLHLVKVIPIGGTSSGKIIREGKENEYSYNAINRSSYTVIAKFGNRTFEFSMRVVENFEEEVKKFEESIAKNSSTEITTIPSGIENVRSKDSLKLNFNPKLCFIAGETEINPSNLVWKLNGNTLLAKGTQIEIPREQIANCKKNNKVEVFKNNASTKSIASYNFSVVKNEIIKFDVSETPKFGKKVTFKVKQDKKYMTFPKLEANEEIYWEVKKGSIFVARGTGLTFEHKFNEEGDFQVRCYISNVVIEEEYNNIKQPKILPNTAKWIDKDGASGNILKKAGYYQEVCAYIEHQELVGEKVSLFIYEKGTNQLIHTEKEFTIKNKKNICIPFTLKKPTVVKDVMQVYFRIKPINSELDIKNIKNQTEEYLTVVNRGDVVDAYFCDANDTKIYRAIEVGTVDLHFKLYMTNMLEKEVEILFYILWDKYPNTTPMKDCLNWVHWEMIAGYFSKKQPFHTTKAKVNNKGEILVEVPTKRLLQIKDFTRIFAVFKIMGSDGKVKGAYLESGNFLTLIPNNSLTHIEENSAPVKVLLEKVNNDVLRQEIGKESVDENTIYITRKWEKWVNVLNDFKKSKARSATYGTFVFGDITGFICEPYGPETTESEQDQRIPTGTYNLEWYPKSGKFPKNVYTKEGRYVIRKYKPFSATYINFPELKNAIIRIYNKDVSKNRRILLHAGYEGGWTEGCINPFKTLSEKLRDKNIELKESIELLFEIYDKIDKIGIEKVKIVIVDEINKPKSKEDEKYGEFIKKRPM